MAFYISKIVNSDFSTVEENVRNALKNEGFGILTEIDVQSTMKKKLDIDFRKYKILGACNPPFAYRALQTEDKIGVMLPCNLIIQETVDGSIEVAAVDPLTSMASIGNEQLKDIAEQIRSKLVNAVNSL
jgi:uncharacterized protein (DUF302 family)